MISSEDGRAACADRLDLVDAAYTSPGGAAAQALKRNYCGKCPIASECLTAAMERREEGVWGGTSPHTRSRRGGPKWSIRSGVRGTYKRKSA